MAEVGRSGLKIPTVGGADVWSAETTPYMIEPMRTLTDRAYDSVVFVGPQRTGKTQALFDIWAAYAIEYDPADMMFLFPGQDLARDYSIRRLSRMIEYNPELKRRIASASRDNVFDKTFTAGNIINLAWPSIGQLRQRDIRFAAVSELDSMPDDIDGAGEIFSLLQKRTQTYLSNGKALAEGAPSKPVKLEAIEDWKPKSDHECMPAEGLAKLYMQGDRRRLYWECLHCNTPFQAAFKYMKWDVLDSAQASSETAHMVCPNCGGIHHSKDKYYLNNNILNGKGGWFKDGELQGSPAESKRASFWLEGVAAGFQPWHEIVYKHILAQQSFEATGDYSSMKTVTNSDIGLQFFPPSTHKGADSARLSGRSEANLQQRIVPQDARVIITSIDQQKSRFVVQVHAYGENRECWILDRYNVTLSPMRVAEDGKPHAISPSEYLEDWDALGKVIGREYKTESGAVMSAKLVIIDSGGANKATQNSYAYWRKFSRSGKDPQLLRIIKGRDIGERISKSEAQYKNTGVPLWLLNVNTLKDETFHALNREEEGAGYIHFPDWLGDWFYEELVSEVRDSKGRWSKRRSKSNNEALDLLGYAGAGYTMLGLDSVDWQDPPAWAKKASERKVKSTSSDTDDDLSWLKEMSSKLNG